MERACEVFDKICTGFEFDPRAPCYVARYLEYLLTWHQFAFDCVVFGQSPYPSAIHATRAAALSYDPDISCGEPPSVFQLARFLSCGDQKKEGLLSACLRDSWRMLYGGMLFVNHNLAPLSSPSLQHSQCVNQVRYIAELLVDRAKHPDFRDLRPELHVVALGNDGAAAAKELASAVSRIYKVRVWRGRHPAYIHRLTEQRQTQVPMLPEPARKYLADRLLSAAMESVKHCDIVTVEGSEYTGVMRVVDTDCLHDVTLAAANSIEEVAMALVPGYPRPIVCIGPDSQQGTVMGAGDNSLGRQIERLRDEIVLVSYGLKPTSSSLNSCAVRALAMSYRGNKGANPQQSADPVALGRIVHETLSIGNMMESVSKTARECIEIDDSNPVPTMPDNLKVAMTKLAKACENTSGGLHVFRARLGTCVQYEAVSRPQTNSMLTYAAPPQEQQSSVQIPSNVASCGSGASVTSPVNSKPARKAIRRPPSSSVSASVSVPSSIPETSAFTSTPTSQSTTGSAHMPSEPQVTPTRPKNIVGRRVVRRTSNTPSAPESPVPDSPDVEVGARVSTMSSYRLSTKPLHILGPSAFSTPATKGPTSSKSSYRESPDLPVGTRALSPKPSAESLTQQASSQHPSSSRSESLKVKCSSDERDMISFIADQANEAHMYVVGDALSSYLDGSSACNVTREVLRLLEGLGESATVETISSAMSPECPSRLKYFTQKLQDLDS